MVLYLVYTTRIRTAPPPPTFPPTHKICPHIPRKVDGVDEVQMIVTSADRVLPHVQTVTTYASDFDEVQTIDVDGDDIDEWQYVSTDLDVGDTATEVQVSQLVDLL